MQAALILVLATLLATTWAKPTIAEDLTGLEDRAWQPGNADNVDLDASDWLEQALAECRRCKCCRQAMGRELL